MTVIGVNLSMDRAPQPGPAEGMWIDGGNPASAGEELPQLPAGDPGIVSACPVLGEVLRVLGEEGVGRPRRPSLHAGHGEPSPQLWEASYLLKRPSQGTEVRPSVSAGARVPASDEPPSQHHAAIAACKAQTRTLQPPRGGGGSMAGLNSAPPPPPLEFSLRGGSGRPGSSALCSHLPGGGGGVGGGRTPHVAWRRWSFSQQRRLLFSAAGF